MSEPVQYYRTSSPYQVSLPIKQIGLFFFSNRLSLQVLMLVVKIRFMGMSMRYLSMSMKMGVFTC